MTKALPHLPISAYVRLNQLRRLKELRDDGDRLSAQQKAMSDQVFNGPSLNRLRSQALEEMVAAGYIDEEIRMVLADPESPYSILIEGLKPEALSETIRAVLRKIRSEQKGKGPEQGRNEHIQRLHRLIDATWFTVAEAGAAHHKSLLDFIDQCGRAIAEAEGIQYTRAGRKTTQHATPEEQPEEKDTPSGEPAEEDPNWEEEFRTDESND